jgi:hypothetical protein
MTGSSCDSDLEKALFVYNAKPSLLGLLTCKIVCIGLEIKWTLLGQHDNLFLIVHLIREVSQSFTFQ